MDKIAARNVILFNYLVESMKELDVDLPSWIDDESHRSSYLGFSSKVHSDTLYESLMKSDIITITRMGYTGKKLLRVAPHFFNTKREIDIFVENLSNQIK